MTYLTINRYSHILERKFSDDTGMLLLFPNIAAKLTTGNPRLGQFQYVHFFDATEILKAFSIHIVLTESIAHAVHKETLVSFELNIIC